MLKGVSIIYLMTCEALTVLIAEGERVRSGLEGKLDGDGEHDTAPSCNDGMSVTSDGSEMMTTYRCRAGRR